jgi:GTP-binding protein YchF
MKIGIIGPQLSGKTTIFNALTSAHAKTSEVFAHKELNRGVVKVPHPKLLKLAELYTPKKITPIEVEYIDVAGLVSETKEKKSEGEFFAHLHEVDALAAVIRTFKKESVVHPCGSINPQRDLENLYTDLIIIDLDIADKRVSKLERTVKLKKSEEEQRELEILKKCKTSLEQGIFLSELQFPAEEEKLLRGFCFLTLKPVLVILNIGEEDIRTAQNLEKEFEKNLKTKRKMVVALCGEIEMELIQLEENDRIPFMQDLGLEKSALNKVIETSFKLLDLITFFTANQNEVRAWAIKRGSTALKAAGTVHSDMEKGFIKAEVVTIDKLLQYGSTHKAKEKGELKLEGKDYIVQDEDVILFRFNV